MPHQGQQEGQQHTWHYAYDPFGRRIAKWQEQAKTFAGKHKKPKPEHITNFTWDGNRLLAEYTQAAKADGSKQQPQIRHKLYLYEPDSFVPLAQITSTWLKDKEARDTPLSNPFLQKITQEAQNDPAIWSGKVLPFQRKLQAKLSAQGIAPDKPKQAIDSSTLYYHTDHLGTPRELTNQEGDIVWAATYKAWGNTEAIEYPKIRQTARSGNTLQEQWVEQEAKEKPQQQLRFQGQYYDEETGLHYNRFRYYDPDCGRFVSQDPIGLYGGNNLYQYAPNPIGWIDPLGLSGNNVFKTQSLREALSKAGDHAKVPRIGKGGENIEFSELNTESRGPNCNCLQARGASGLGRRNPRDGSEIFDHPDGHPHMTGTGQPAHHGSPHVHGKNSKGETLIFTYPASK